MANQGFSDENQVQDLEHALNDLQNVKLDSGEESETQKLKRLFLTFKTKYQKALKELAKREQSQGPSHLSKKYEEAKEENLALVEQQQILKEMLQKVQKELQDVQQGKEPTKIPVSPTSQKVLEQNQKLQHALQEKDRQIADLKHYELGFKRLSDDNLKLEQALNTHGKGEREQLKQELIGLKHLVEKLTSENQYKQQLLDQLQQQTESLSDQGTHLEKELREKTQENQQLKDELEQMKETMVRGLREARELKQYYQNLIDDKTTVLQKNTRIQRHLDEVRGEVKRREHELENSRTETAAAKAEKQEVERLLEQEKQERKEREENLNSLSEQIQLIRSQLKKSQEQTKEKETGVIEAQQHLAKKVREASQLSEMVEEKNQQITRLQEEVIEAKAKAIEAKGILEAQQEETKRIKEQINVWEEKYFRTYEKLQEAESTVRELKKVEEKHQQMQHLLSSLGNVMGQPIGITQPIGMVSEGFRPPVQPVNVPPPKRQSKTKTKPQSRQESLFDIQDTPQKPYKNDLFE